MFEVVRVKNDNRTVVEILGKMSEDEFINFSRQYIGDDKSKWGVIFVDEQDLLSDIEYIKEEGHELWFESPDTNLKIYYIEE